MPATLKLELVSYNKLVKG